MKRITRIHDLDSKPNRERVKVMLDYIVDGYSRREAARRAGFANPNQDAYPVLDTEEAAEYVQSRLQQKIKTEYAPEAFQRSLHMMRSKHTSDRIKWEIQRLLMAYGAKVIMPTSDKDDDPKTPNEMTSDELKGFIQIAEDELSRRALPIEGEGQSVNMQTIDNVM